MKTKSVISLSTGLEDAEKVTVAFLVAVGSAETERPTLMFLTKEAVRLATADTSPEVRPARDAHRSRTCSAGTPRPSGRFMVCPICFNSRHLEPANLLANAELGGTVPMWGWIGDEAANTFSY